jgi:hypothetical protein
MKRNGDRARWRRERTTEKERKSASRERARRRANEAGGAAEG